MTSIDSQVHAYEANTPKRPWHSVPNWPDHVTGDEVVVAMDKVGVGRFARLCPRPIRGRVRRRATVIFIGATNDSRLAREEILAS